MPAWMSVYMYFRIPIFRQFSCVFSLWSSLRCFPPLCQAFRAEALLAAPMWHRCHWTAAQGNHRPHRWETQYKDIQIINIIICFTEVSLSLLFSCFLGLEMFEACCMVKYPLRFSGFLEYFPAIFMLIYFWSSTLWEMKIHPTWKLELPPFCVFANPFVQFFWIGALMSTKDTWRLKLSPKFAKWCPKSQNLMLLR